MPSYSFYPYLPNRSCLTFLVADLDGDAEALGHARLVLLEHVSASEVAVWSGERAVGLVGAYALSRRRGRKARVSKADTTERFGKVTDSSPHKEI